LEVSYYPFVKSVCPSESEMMAEWGHVRRCYTLAELRELSGLPCKRYATFINPLTALCHDFAFSSLSPRQRELLCLILSPITWLGYILYKPTALGTETASLWQK
jgi:hypothetical protein